MFNLLDNSNLWPVVAFSPEGDGGSATPSPASGNEPGGGVGGTNPGGGEAGDSGNDPGAAEPAGATMPEGLDPKFWDQQTGQVRMEDLVKEHSELSQFKTEHDERMASVPEKPEDYKVELPQDLEVPEGLEVKLDENSAVLAEARQTAQEMGLTQEAFSRLLALHARQQIEDYKQALNEDAEEQKKLGDNGPARTKAVEDYLKANLQQDQYEALRPVVWNAKAFEAMEKLIEKSTKQNVAPSPEQNSQNQPPEKPRAADIFYGPERKAS